MPEKGKTLGPANHAQGELTWVQTIAATLETPATSPTLLGAQNRLNSDNEQWLAPTRLGPVLHPHSILEFIMVELWGSLQLLHKGWIAMLQAPLTLPFGSPWDPCIDAMPLLCVSRATIMSSVIERGLFICCPRASLGGSVSSDAPQHRGARGQAVTRAQNASFHQMRA